MPDVVPSLCFLKLYILYYIVLVIAVVYLTAWVSKWAALPHHSPGHDPGGTELCGQLCQWPWPHLLLRQPHPVHSIRYDHAHLSHELAGMFWLLLDWNRRNVHIFVVSRSLADQTILSINGFFVTDIDRCGGGGHWRRTEEGVPRQAVHPGN